MHHNPSDSAPVGESLFLDRVARVMARGMKPLLQLLAFTLSLSLFADSQLSKNSPFLPPGYGEKEPEPPAPVVQPQGPISREIEFRGIVQMGGVYQFSIYNKTEQKGYWMKENAREGGVSVNSFDATSSTIVVVMNGRSERLTLMTATESPMPVAQAIPAASNKNILPPQLQNPSSATNTNNRRVVPRRRVILPKKN
jgi:hypothetical protein